MIQIEKNRIVIDDKEYTVGGVESYSVNRHSYWDGMLQRHIPNGMTDFCIIWKDEIGVKHEYERLNFPDDELVVAKDCLYV